MELKQGVREAIGPFATPDVIQYAPGLPKTRSGAAIATDCRITLLDIGKIMRRILRKIASYKEDDIGDVSTLAEPNVVELLLEHRAPREAGPDDDYG